MSTTDDQTINLPQLFLVIFLGCIALRYFFFSSDSPPLPGRASSSSSSSARRAREADVERIQQMFPQVERRSIMWDLQRNGGNVVATTERILSGRGLEVPPQSFQPLPAPSSNTPSSSSTPSTTKSKSKPLHPDLITRYNLQNRLSTDPTTDASTSSPPAQQQQNPSPSPARSSTSTPRKSWSANKTERQALLQKRRDEMILAARRKMEERLAREEEGAGAGGAR